MKMTEALYVQNFIRMTEDGWDQGWHECHAGNLSYRVKPEELEQVKEDLNEDGQWFEIGADLPGIAGEYFLVTGSGKFFRNTVLDPEDSFGMIKIDETGSKYKVVWGLTNGGKPTSELPAHLMNHEVKKQVADGKYRVVYHAHPANIIALSFILPPDDVTFTRELWEMEPECAMVFPGGMGVLPWMVPGTVEIADKTCELMKEYDVVLWAQHGLFATGDTFDNTFGLAHTVEKAAEMLLKTLSTPQGKCYIPTVQDFKDMAKVFNLDLPEKFLYEK